MASRSATSTISAATERAILRGSFDPFEGLPIESFEPPANAKVKDKMAWKSHVRDMLHRVKAQKVGGKALRAFMDEEVEKLQLERMTLFCEALLESKISK